MNQKPEITKEIFSKNALTEEEFTAIKNILNREPNLIELGMFSVMWSEHCSYKSSKKWLRTLPDKAPWVICGPGENAGVIDIGDGQAAIFKIESHNHPSYIEPYQGAATGVGGILRDVFTMGARPVANLNALSFGSPDHPGTRHLLSGVVSGIGGYGNCVGIPTVGGALNFDSAYNGNILVNAMAVGVAETNRIFYSTAAGVGNPVVYVGSKTGRDGIHGATMASAEFDDNSEEKRPTVQVGDPFTEKLLIESCLELMATDTIVAIQDMGAAGLTCSSLEMADKGKVGIELNLDKVPQRETEMSAYEIMLSESQERMLMVLQPEGAEHAKRIFEKWGLDFAVIGYLNDTGRFTGFHFDKVAFDIPITPLVQASPEYDRPWTPTAKSPPLKVPEICASLGDALKKVICAPEIASRRWIWEQYDYEVMADTVDGPGGDAAVIRIHGTNKGLVIAADCTPRYCVADPTLGGAQAVAEVWRNITATGGTPLAITDCLNFGNPERPEIMGQLVGCIEGMREACTALDFPVVSGNVSLYNETNGKAILPTPTIGGVGILKDLNLRADTKLIRPNDTIILIGGNPSHLGKSVYLQQIFGRSDGTPPNVDLKAERRNGDFVRKLITDELVNICHDVSDGGLMVAVAEMAISGGIGVELDGPALASFWFGEDQARYVLSVPPNVAPKIESNAIENGIPCQRIGQVVKTNSLTPANEPPISLSELTKLHENWLPDLMSN